MILKIIEDENSHEVSSINISSSKSNSSANKSISAPVSLTSFSSCDKDWIYTVNEQE